jgi:hypothetical protein
LARFGRRYIIVGREEHENRRRHLPRPHPSTVRVVTTARERPSCSSV